MKRLINWAFAMLLVIVCVNPSGVFAQTIVDITKQYGYSVSSDVAPKASIVVDAKTGQILWNENETQLRDPASLSKLMVVYLLMEAVGNNRLTLQDTITATDSDAKIATIPGISTSAIVEGVSYKIEDLLKMTVAPSSNVATLMIARYLSKGDDVAFLEKMNAKAKELGMNDTTFVTATGAVSQAFNGLYAPLGYPLDQPNQTTAKDLALLAYYLLQKYPQVTQYTSQQSVGYSNVQQAGSATYTNTNNLLSGSANGVTGVNGLKTGSSPMANYNIIASVERSEFSVIVVVLGAGQFSVSSQARDLSARALIDYVYDQMTKEIVVNTGTTALDQATIYSNDVIYYLKGNGVDATAELDGKQVAINYSNGNILNANTRLYDVVVEYDNQQEVSQTTLLGWLIISTIAIIGWHYWGVYNAKNRNT